jgi:predicted RNA-binding Zn-ribbon protein involved in translation (DUF1610 family)
MSQLSSTFATMVRQAARSFRYFCDHCNRETLWQFVTEDPRMEFYQCAECGHTKGWAVR